MLPIILIIAREVQTITVAALIFYVSEIFKHDRNYLRELFAVDQNKV